MNIETNWEWSTHQPMIHLMMSMYQPKLVLELGTGDNSTPLFLTYAPQEFICIENDSAWLDRIGSRYTFKVSYLKMHHDLGEGIHLATKLHELSEKKKLEIEGYYSFVKVLLSEKTISPKLLFVDQFTCLRTISMKMLGTEFDIIIYHDCQPEGIDWYSYHFDNLFADYTAYVLKSPSSWTGCLIHNRLEQDEQRLRRTITPLMYSFCRKNVLKLTDMSFVKQ